MDVSNFHDFLFSLHTPRPTVDISKFSNFFSFPRIFHDLKCVFRIFRDFQFSRHIPGPSVCISHFSRLSADQYFDGLISDCDKVYARWKAISDSARNMIVFAADGVSHQVSDNNVGGMLHLYVYDSVGYVNS